MWSKTHLAARGDGWKARAEKAEAEVERLREVVRECRNAIARYQSGRHPAQGECPIGSAAFAMCQEVLRAEAALGEEEA